MPYDREIEDSVLIQLIILFAIQKAGKPIKQSQLEDLVLGNCNINFINYRLAIVHLIKINHITETPAENETLLYDITEEGLQSIEFFMSEIPVYIREPIANAIVPMFRLEEKKKSVTAELLPLSLDEFTADCAIYDSGKPLLKLNFYTGTRELTTQAIMNFKKHPDKVYKAILDILMAPIDEDDFIPDNFDDDDNNE